MPNTVIVRRKMALSIGRLSGYVTTPMTTGGRSKTHIPMLTVASTKTAVASLHFVMTCKTDYGRIFVTYEAMQSTATRWRLRTTDVSLSPTKIGSLDLASHTSNGISTATASQSLSLKTRRTNQVLALALVYKESRQSPSGLDPEAGSHERPPASFTVPVTRSRGRRHGASYLPACL